MDKNKPDTFSKNLQRDHFLSPAYPDVRIFLSRVIEEIVLKYPVDGIHLDYIRYPSIDSGFEPHAREKFRKTFDIDPVDLFDRSEFDGSSPDGARKNHLKSEWYRWRAQQLTELLGEIRKVQETRSPGTILSVAVIPDILKAFESYGQNWVTWANEGIVDLVVTMSYSPNKKVVLSQAKKARKAVRSGLLFVGVAAYNQPIGDVLECVRELKTIDIDGFSLFSYNTLLEEPANFTLIRETLLPDQIEIRVHTDSVSSPGD
jgi:uncharacterized lipoprotein YddW (UPF0748 family)